MPAFRSATKEEEKQFGRFCHLSSFGRFGNDTLTSRKWNQISLEFFIREPNSSTTGAFQDQCCIVLRLAN